ncbi:MAG: PstS family phosphate ABC transporter substrate-binding protein [Bacteroidia bacterium]
MKIWKIEIFIFLIIAMVACKSKPDNEHTDTLDSGVTKISMDDSYIFLFETMTRVFEDQHPSAKIISLVKNENDAIQALLNDSSKVIVLNRELTKNELIIFKNRNIFPKSIRFAYDAVALIIHPDNPDSSIDVEDLKSLLTGKITKWNQLGKNGDKDVVVVFDKPNSANFRYMKDTLLGGQELQKNCFGVNSNKEVIEYVKKNKNAIGIISAGWITDDYSNVAKSFLKSVKVMGVGHKSSGLYYKPYQYYIHDGSYPFVRSVFLVNRQTRMGLGTGFVNFVCKADKGQFIVTKSGLVPVYAYIREINANVE